MTPDAPIDGRAILAVGPNPPPYHGASVVHEAVVEWLRSRGANVTVANTSGAGHTGLQFHMARTFQHLAALLGLIRGPRHKLGFYITGAGGLGLWYQLALVSASRVLGVPTVFHHHSYAYLRKRSHAMQFIVHVGGSHLTHILLSRAMGSLFGHVYPGASRIEICSNAAFVRPSETVTPRVRMPGVQIGHLSNLSSEKGLTEVLASHRAAIGSGLDVHLHLAGPTADPEAKEILRRALEGTNGNSITYHGALERSQVPAFLALLDVFVFPSRYRNEAEPLVVLEALNAHVPVITFAVGCLSSALQASPWPAITDHSISEALVRELRKLSEHDSVESQAIFLHEVARLQRQGFGPQALSVIENGLRT